MLKGWAVGAYSKVLTFVFEPVTKSHNIIFEPQLWIITHLWNRGTFGSKVNLCHIVTITLLTLYQTLDEIMFGSKDELEIILEMHDKPLRNSCTLLTIPNPIIYIALSRLMKAADTFYMMSWCLCLA